MSLDELLISMSIVEIGRVPEGQIIDEDGRRVWKRTPTVTLYTVESGDYVVAYLTVGAIPAG